MLYYIILHQVVTKIQLVKSNLKAIHMLKHATGRLNCVSLYYKHCINLAPKFAFSMLILRYKNHFCLKKKGLMEKRRGAKISTKPLLIPPMALDQNWPPAVCRLPNLQNFIKLSNKAHDPDHSIRQASQSTNPNAIKSTKLISYYDSSSVILQMWYFKCDSSGVILHM